MKGGSEPRSRWCPRHQRPALRGARRKDELTLSEPVQEAEGAAAAEPLPGADSPARWVPGLLAEVSVDWVLPQLGVSNQRQMFNRATTGSIRVTAASCAVVGVSMAGGGNAIVGGLLGLMLADHGFRNDRFIR